MSKLVKNILSNWIMEGGSTFTVIGTALVDQPSAGVKSGNLLRTSAILGIRRLNDGTAVLETRNSLYYLVD